MITKEKSYKKISELVERFEEQYASYKNSDYNETLTRRDFIDPFFKALGWDIDNEQGYAEAYREVIHEDKIKIEGVTKAPDYAFRAGGDKKLFFVEAKKPSVVIKDDTHPAIQVRRYGWNAKLAISIVTDFEEFAVYDCSKKPLPKDKASVARIRYLTFRDYLNEFDFLWSTFAKESVLKGSFDKFVQGISNKRGTETVDKDFLKTLDGWRTYLATSISRDNKELNEDEINFAVQQTIDRIIFLRIAEGRKVEPEGNLQTAIMRGDYYQNLFRIFKEADDKYNSGLFDFKKDTISKNLKIDNKIIKTIINELYYPKSQYEFSVLSVEILGSAYEQFLGKVIRITPAHYAKIEEKPEVRKAGGVYYTPEYIVEYIVKNTVGKLIEGKTPKEISKIKIVDPACGSGSFLIGAYQYLLNYHKNYYSNNGKSSKGKKEDTLTPEGYLTTAEKKRILLNNIYGVDIDVNAVEVTKLSLLLKCMEGETEASIAHQLSMFHERVLPTLENNIKSGNSLVGTDIYENELFEVDKKTKPFNWEKEFPEVFVVRIEETDPREELKRIAHQAKAHAQKALEYSTELSEKLELVYEPKVNYEKNIKGGFDVVIGNPPYLRMQGLQETQPNAVNYYKQNYLSAKAGNFDLYVLFDERGFNLLNEKGMLGFIQPHKFFQADFGEGLRNLLAKEKALEEIVNFGSQQVFSDVTTYTCLLFLNKKKQNEINITTVNDLNTFKLDSSNAETFSCLQPQINTKWNFVSSKKQSLLDKLFKQQKTLADITRKIFVGLQTSADKIYVLETKTEKSKTIIAYSQSLDEEVEIEKGLIRSFLMGKDVKRYEPLVPRNVVIFPYLVSNGKAVLMNIEFIKNNFPLGWNYILRNKKELEGREHDKMKGDHFYAYIYPKNLAEFEVEKICTPDIASKPKFTIDKSKQLYHTTTVYSFVFKADTKENEKYFLGLLNSPILWYFLQNTGNVLRGGFFRFKTEYLKPFPIKLIDFKNKTEVEQHDEIVKFVGQLLKLNEEKANTKLQSKMEEIQRHIEFCEEQINIKVYKLYELTTDEIEIVKGKLLTHLQ
jgi:type I restriction-modification system DNA methylase subunit